MKQAKFSIGQCIHHRLFDYRGVVVDVGEVANAVLESIRLAVRTSGYEIASAYVGLAGAHISAVNSRGVVAINQGERGIRSLDIDRVLEATRAIDIPQNREILHVIPRSYSVDGEDGVRDPVGMQAFRLEAEAHIVTGDVNRTIEHLLHLDIPLDRLRIRARDLEDLFLECNEKSITSVEGRPVASTRRCAISATSFASR